VAIRSIESLKTHLQWAIEVEHATIPPYLCAMYSIVDTASEPFAILRSIAMEEMLHAALDCNLLNAIGGEPTLDDPEFVPQFPGPMPHHCAEEPLVLRLAPCSVQLVRDTLMPIEQPEAPTDPPEDDRYHSLGQFYRAIELGFETLCAELGEGAVFSGDEERQLQSGYWGGGGTLVSVHDLASAKRAIEEIITQGEGAPERPFDDDGELAHFFRLRRIADGSVALGAVLPMQPDPSLDRCVDPATRELAELFNDCYGLLLRHFTRAANGQPDWVLTSAALMKNVLGPIARRLMELPADPNRPEAGNAGPTFQPTRTTDEATLERCRRLAREHPVLTKVGSALAALPAFENG
jgi:hypothetical protein